MRYFSIIVLIAFYSCNENSKPADFANSQKNKIKTRTEFVYTTINFEHGDKSSMDTYDISGKIITNETYSCGEILSKTLYKYSSDLIIEEVFQDYESDRKITYYYLYNKNLLQKKNVKDRNNNSTDSIIYKYDDSGKLLNTTYYILGDSTGNERYKYDNRGRLIQKNSSNKDVSNTYFYSYKDSLLIEEQIILKDLALDYESKELNKYSYDKWGVLVEKKTYTANDSKLIFVSKYSYSYFY